jgi:hypothetical protein
MASLHGGAPCKATANELIWSDGSIITISVEDRR